MEVSDGPTKQTGVCRNYQDDGYFLCDKPAIPANVVDRAVGGMDEIRSGYYDTGRPPHDLYAPGHWKVGDDPNALCKMEQPQFASRAVMELVRHPSIGKWAAAVTGAAIVQVWWVQLLYKPPAVKPSTTSTNIGWHQDRQYWGAWEEGSEVFTAWIALSDVTAQAGPMRYVRGSHKWGAHDEGDFKGTDHAAQRSRYRLPDGAEWSETPAILPPGGISLHHNHTLHASGPNLTDEPRRSFAVHMRTERARPKDGRREGLTAYIDDRELCPVIYREPGAVLSD